MALSAALTAGAASQHPCLLFNAEELGEMKAGMKEAPLFEQSIARTIAKAEASLGTPVEVPVPCDGGGGPVHERHKSNYYELMDCGVAYQFTGDKRYASRAGEMLEAYAELYPTLSYHKLGLSPVPGRLFWQTLNESVWLVHVSVAYDCVRDCLTEEQRGRIESRLLLPMADFIMTGTDDNRANLKTFNKMHNHGTWATAAVGMAGMATDRDDLVDKALYGTDKTGKNGGFLQQMDWLFSPDGYFTEGAYYQRYALWPFVIFAQCLDHNRPELAVFKHRDGILSKAFDALFQLSYEGEFMHINDAMEKGLSAQEIVYAANILFGAEPDNRSIPYIARLYHRESIPCVGGYRLARAIANGAGAEPTFRSMVLRDGRDGSEGGFGIIRDTTDGLNSALTMKATSHGLSHGHYDKLTMALYDNGSEILTDYGASRFINLEAKNSGHYTRENDSFCKQSVAHNTLVADETSHFGGVYKISSKHHSDFIDHITEPAGRFQAMTAKEENAYADKGIAMERSLVQTRLPGTRYPVTLDLMKVKADGKHQYDMPYWYRGHVVSTNTDRKRSLTNLTTLGTAHGYQHIWVDADCRPKEGAPMQFTFFNGDRMYSITTDATAPIEGKLTHLGANDPDFNLREEKGWLVRVPEAADCVIATIIEPHGEYDVVRETAAGTKSAVSDVKIVADNTDHTAVRVSYGEGRSALFLVAREADPAKKHTAEIDGRKHSWTGHYEIKY
ncbi:MAG: alginate lyase family protein [Muribaculaceae bacterium]|nr:alginate lyase family protein [Muribaculaceae bacterium]